MKELLKMKDSLTENETINLLSFEQTDILKGIAILLVVVSQLDCNGLALQRLWAVLV